MPSCFRFPLRFLITSAMVLSVPACLPAQDVVLTSSPTSVVPHLIKYSGAFSATPGNSTVEVKFALYAASSGGEGLWSENQKVALDASGKYSVLLGSVTALPDSAFANGAARWIGVTLSGEQESTRTVLVATPYSLKASDAETLGGHPVSDFALKNALPAGGTNITQINVGNGVTGGGTGPTVTLGLSSTYLENLGNQIYPQLGGTNSLTGKNTYSAGKLLIGSSPVLSTTNVLASSPLTATASGNNVTIGLSDSGLLTLGNSVYAQLGAANTFSGANTFSKAVTFASGQSFPGTVSLSANNTFTGTNSFSKAITFASGQTFPGTGSGTITGVSTTSPLSGAGTSGNVALSLNTSALETTLNGVYAQLGAANTFAKAITFASGQTFPGTGNGTITGITTTSPLSGSGTSGTVPLSLNTSALETTLNSVYAQLGAANTFAKAITFASGQTFPGTALLSGNNSLTGDQGIAGTESISGSAAEVTSGGNYNGQLTVIDTNASGLGIGVNASGASSVGILASGGAIGAEAFGASGDESTIPGTGIGAVGLGGVGVFGDTTYTASDHYGAGVEGYVGSSYAGGAQVIGVYGDENSPGSSGYAVYGATQNGDGVVGYSVSGAYGVWGYDYSASGVGVFGEGSSGVYGLTSSVSGDGVVGKNSSTSGTASGVYGATSSEFGHGVHGTEVGESAVGSSQVGVYGAGVWGDSNQSGEISAGGIFGTADDGTAATFFNKSDGESTLYVNNFGTGGLGDAVPVFAAAGRNGACGINGGGDVTCSGQIKTAVTVSGAAQRVEVYSVQSSENWLEDFGTAKLDNGHTTVPIDAQFAKIVNTGVSYHVFLTPKGDCKGLYVTNEGTGGFEVRELGSGGSTVEFDYRIVAKRSGYEAERLADATAEMHSLTARRDRAEARLAAMPQRSEPSDATPPTSGAPMQPHHNAKPLLGPGSHPMARQTERSSLK